MTIRYKVVPPARGLDVLQAVADALPLVPGDEDDCCARIRDATAVESRAEARRWLTFAVALGLAAETDRGYHQVRESPTARALADRFRKRVFPVREVIALLESEGPLSAGLTFEALRDDLPRWERSHRADWAAEWRDRVGHLLEWCVLLGLAERAAGGYRAGKTEADAVRTD